MEYELRDIKENNPTYEELKSWFFASNLPIKRFFNTSGLLYKDLGLKDKLPDMSNDEALKLLATDGMLVKRPILLGYGTVLVGFKQDEWEPLLTHAKQVMAGKVRDAGIAAMIKGQYDVIVRDLEWGASILLDTSGFRKEHEDGGIVTGYNKTLCNDHTRAIYYAEKFLASLEESKCPVKYKPKRGVTGDEHRLEQSKWMKEAAAEIREWLAKEDDYKFWSARMLIPG